VEAEILKVILFIYFYRSVHYYKIRMGMEIVTFFRNQEVKPLQMCTTITWSSTIFDVSSQYELFDIGKYNNRYNKTWHM